MQSDTMLIREAAREDLAAVLSLYAHLHDADEKAGDRVLERICLEIPADPRTHLFILEYEGVPVATCVLHIHSNLTRGARPYGLIENVVTHREYRNRGFGTTLPHSRAGLRVGAELLQGDAPDRPERTERLPALREGRISQGRKGRAHRISAGVIHSHIVPALRQPSGTLTVVGPGKISQKPNPAAGKSNIR